MTTVVLPQEALEELCAVLEPHAGVYSLSSFPLIVELTPTTITDQDGKTVSVIE